MKQIRIYLPQGLWGSFTHVFDRLPYIRRHFNIVYDDINPQLVIWYDKYNIHNPPRTKYKCKHLLYCAEYTTPNMGVWDYALKWDHTRDDCCLRFPTYVMWGAGEDIVKPPNYNPEEILRSKKKFCAFVQYSYQSYRNSFFKILNSYNHVDAPGKQCNNMPPLGGNTDPKDSRYNKKRAWVLDVREFFKDYKFVIAFENGLHSGYVTEKIYNPMLCNTIPIYIGSPEIHRDFNTKSFVHVRDFFRTKNVSVKGVYTKQFHAAAKYIMELDSNNQLYCDILAQPWYNNNVINSYANVDNITKFFAKIFMSL
jgi:hypothetical protein